jgi:hypothetical protein
VQQAVEYAETPTCVQQQQKAEQNDEAIDAVARHFMVVVDATHTSGR